VGSELDAEELAELLSECREQAAAGKDRELLDQALRKLSLPTSDNGRVTLDRIVQRVSRHLRGALGGWIVPLDRIEEILRTELMQVDFPRKFPETTTGSQALSYIRDVWRRAQHSPEGLANEVRDVLPLAYIYCLEDIAQDDSLLEQWRETMPQAMVFAEREWVALAGTGEVYFDDIDDRRFFPSQGQFRIVTSGHLGRSRPDQLRTAGELGVPLLSSIVTMEWIGGDKMLPVSDAWADRFELIWRLLLKVRGSEPSEGTGADNRTETLPLRHVNELALNVSVEDAIAENVPVNARLHEDALTVAGRAVECGADAAKELLRHFFFGQRAGLAADLTGMFVAIENADFNLAADKFRRSHAPEFELPASFRISLDGAESVVSEGGPARSETTETTAPNLETGADSGVPKGQTPTSGITEYIGPDPSGSATEGDINAAMFKDSEREEPGSTGGSYTKDRSLAKQNALARQLKISLKGEIVPSPEEDNVSGPVTTNGNMGKGLGDEEYRKIAAQYEREAGREPELGDPLQSGWDIRSIDPETQEVRLIEVKGRGRSWDGTEVVELSSAQVRKAFEAKESWYLYVVEKTNEARYQVLPIENPVHSAAKWILCGESWRMVAEDAKIVASPPN